MKDEKERSALLSLRNYLRLLRSSNRVAACRLPGLAELARRCEAELVEADLGAIEVEPPKPSASISTRLTAEIERLHRYLRRISYIAGLADASPLRLKVLRLANNALREETDEGPFTGWRDFSGGSK